MRTHTDVHRVNTDNEAFNHNCVKAKIMDYSETINAVQCKILRVYNI